MHLQEKKMTIGYPEFGPLVAQLPASEAWTNPFNGLILALALIVNAVGIGVILWGVYGSVLRLLATESAARGQDTRSGVVAGRSLFAAYLLPGLDFLIAGSLIKTIAASDWLPVLVLGGIVAVRTLVGLSLKWEGTSNPALKEPAQVADRAGTPRQINEKLNLNGENSIPVGAQADS
jgi:uncharacterized membrane protein